MKQWNFHPDKSKPTFLLYMITDCWLWRQTCHSQKSLSLWRNIFVHQLLIWNAWLIIFLTEQSSSVSLFVEVENMPIFVMITSPPAQQWLKWFTSLTGAVFCPPDYSLKQNRLCRSKVNYITNPQTALVQMSYEPRWRPIWLWCAKLCSVCIGQIK